MKYNSPENKGMQRVIYVFSALIFLGLMAIVGLIIFLILRYLIGLI